MQIEKGPSIESVDRVEQRSHCAQWYKYLPRIARKISRTDHSRRSGEKLMDRILYSAKAE